MSQARPHRCFLRTGSAIVVVPPLYDELDFDLLFDDSLASSSVACTASSANKPAAVESLPDHHEDDGDKNAADDAVETEDSAGPLTQLWEGAFSDHLDYIINDIKVE